MSDTTASPQEILEFWFGPAVTPESETPRDCWFVKDAGFDVQIRERFGATLRDGLAGGLDRWIEEPQSALAYIVLLDQFTRNAFRGTPESFAGDPRALRAARRIVARGWDLPLAPVRRWFCYLPFEHSEVLADQDRSVELFGSLRDDPASRGTIDYADRHREVIRLFGRFPHRNPILGRESTHAEREYLSKPGSGF